MLRDDSVLVTGGAGFIGSHLVEQLRKKYPNARIISLDNFSAGFENNLKHIKNIESINCDIRDEKKIREIVKRADVVFHLAAQAFIPYCYQDPKEFITTNILGTYNLIMSARKSNIKSFVFVSTSEVYGTTREFSISEDHSTRPHSTYATTKLAAENLAYTLYREQYIPLVIIRPFNTYGPRDSHPRIIPEIIKQFSNSSELNLGNINATRDFMYVEDTAHALIKAAETPRAIGEIINIGSGTETSVKTLIQIIAELTSKEKYKVNIKSNKLRPLDVDRLCAEISKSKEILKWEPKISLLEGLKKTIEWYGKQKVWNWENKCNNQNSQ